MEAASFRVFAAGVVEVQEELSTLMQEEVAISAGKWVRGVGGECDVVAVAVPAYGGWL